MTGNAARERTRMNNWRSNVRLAPALRLLEFLPDVYYFVKDAKGRFLDANRQFAEMMGARRVEDILGKTDYDFSPRTLADAFEADDREVMKTGKDMINRVELVPRPDGSIRWHLTSKVPLRDAGGRVVGLAGITRNLHKASTTLRPFRAMSEVLDHIENHYAEPITVQTLADLVHLSVSQFERRFKALFNITPIGYLLKIRVNRACYLLAETNTKITEIATQCGFYDHSHFIRRFTRAMGVSPRAYHRERAAK